MTNQTSIWQSINTIPKSKQAWLFHDGKVKKGFKCFISGRWSVGNCQPLCWMEITTPEPPSEEEIAKLRGIL